MTDAGDSAAPRPDPESELGEEHPVGRRAPHDTEFSGRDPITGADGDGPESAPREGDAVVAEDSSASQPDAVDADSHTVAAGADDSDTVAEPWQLHPRFPRLVVRPRAIR